MGGSGVLVVKKLFKTMYYGDILISPQDALHYRFESRKHEPRRNFTKTSYSLQVVSRLKRLPLLFKSSSRTLKHAF